MAHFTLAEVLRAADAETSWSDPVSFDNVVTDTRRIKPGSLFVALRGERFNGEDFALDAVQKGAAGIVVSRDFPAAKLEGHVCPVLRVQDTLAAYQSLAHAWRMRFSIPVVAITGSNGKTTTKDLTAAVLSSLGLIHRTEANFNNEIGLPLTLLGLTEAHRAAVVEIGMRGLGQIAALAPVAAPSIGVVTNVGESHLEMLGSRDNIARAKSELVEAIEPGGTVVLNADDPRVAAMAQRCRPRVKVLTFGVTARAMVRGGAIRAEGFASRFAVSFSGRPAVSFMLPLAGRHNVHNALAALAVGWALGLTPEDMGAGLARPALTGQRFECRRRGDYWIINDAYNASPASMVAALQTLSEIAPGRRIAVLGDMLELGEMAPEAHRRVGVAAAAAGVAALVTCGEMGKVIAAGARSAGLTSVHYCGSQAEAGEVLRGLLQADDTVLFKGSHGMRMDKIIDLI